MNPIRAGTGVASLLAAALALWHFTGTKPKEDRAAPLVTLSEQAVQQSPSPAPAINKQGGDGYIGRWEGLDGRFMLIEKNVAPEPGPYAVTMRYDLNRAEQSYPAEMEGTSVFVQRNGSRLEFAPSDGRASSDTRLHGRKDCLSTNSGETYCRG